jgi:hypothetical protein
MSRQDDVPHAWHEVNRVTDAARVKQKAVGYGVAEDNARRKKIAAQRALRLAREADQPPAPPEPAAKRKPRKTAKAKDTAAAG